MNEEIIVISLGGSLIIPEQPDVNFLKKFREFILSQVAKGKKFVLITGGGKIARLYQAAGKEVTRLSDKELDWLGIYATRLNAGFLKVLFGSDHAEEEIVTNPNLFSKFTKSILVGAGWEPGWSTDYDAVVMAKTVGAKTIINMSNIDHVYDADPKQNPEAKKLDKVSWSDYRNIIPREWTPGLNTPFDPMASEIAQEAELRVVIMNGDIENLENFLEGRDFQGTLIG